MTVKKTICGRGGYAKAGEIWYNIANLNANKRGLG